MSDKDFLEMCKAFDPSAEVDKARQFEKIKTKLNQEERIIMNKNRKMKKPAVALVAALVGVMSISAVAIAAVNGNWRHSEIVILEGEQYVNEFTRMENLDEGIIMGSRDIYRYATSPIVIEVDGVAEVIQDLTILHDLDEALAKLTIDVLQPAYLPEGFTFSYARFDVDPIRNPDHWSAGTSVALVFANGDQEFRLSVMYYPVEWGMPYWSAAYEDLEINGSIARIGEGMFMMLTGEIGYTISSGDLTHEQIVQIAKSLK
ncbi:MAG: hypothetical protein FWD97_07285 [Defluviitaleaceae bacterium]|nr:hypothetical protein [Defluviitaleaceae bacterium]